MKSHLSVKVFSLQAEMHNIHRKEIRWKKRARIARQKSKDPRYAEDNFWSLRNHRTGLKPEARSSHLAYGFMRGRSYHQMERICYGDMKGYGSTPPDWKRIEEIVEKFSRDETDPRDIMQRFGEWLELAKIWYKGNETRIPLEWAMQEKARKQRREDTQYQADRDEHANRAREAGIAAAKSKVAA